MAMMRWDDMTWDQKYAWYDANQPKPWNPKSNRAIRFRSCNRAPNSKLTKGYVKQAKKNKRSYGGLNLREMQKAFHKLQRLEDKREIELGLLDFELEQKSKALNAAKDMMMCGYGYEEVDSSLDDFLEYMYEDDDYFSEPEEPSRLKGVSCDYAIVDELDLMWQYKHEGD